MQRPFEPADLKAVSARAQALDRLHAAKDWLALEQACISALNAQAHWPHGLLRLGQIRWRQGNLIAARALLGRGLQLAPRQPELMFECSRLALAENDLLRAGKLIRDAIRLRPEHAALHHHAGRIMNALVRRVDAEFHWRLATRLAPEQWDWRLDHASVLIHLGRYAEAERQIAEVETAGQATARCAATRQQLALRLHAASGQQAEARGDTELTPRQHLAQAQTLAAAGDAEAALAYLHESLPRLEEQTSAPLQYFLGDLHDRLGDYELAFAAYERANARVLERLPRPWSPRRLQQLIAAVPGVFPGLRHFPLPPQALPSQPLFVLGFPRSGTTLTEQILGMHSAVDMGGELTGVEHCVTLLAQRYGPRQRYPECLREAWQSDSRGLRDELRHSYLVRAQDQLGRGIEAPFISDKMPLNETHLGLINFLFPESPLVLLQRHPLDVVLSCFSKDLTHGGYCSYRLDTLAQHYLLMHELVESYCAHADVPLIRLRYEELVSQPEAQVKQLLHALGLEFQAACMQPESNQRVPATPSFQQVVRPIHTEARHRFVHYRAQLAPAEKLLRPLIDKLGYSLD